MKILWVGAKYMAGTPESGHSYEHTNFYETLTRMDGGNHEVDHFDFDVKGRELGAAALGSAFLDLVAARQPDLVFAMLFHEELPEALWSALKARPGAPVLVNWFADDQWRFGSYTRRYARHFDLAVTTDPLSLPLYRAAGQPRALLSQWGVNHYAYAPQPGTMEHELSFVGQAHGSRRASIAALAQQGCKVECWGKGWEQGALSHDAMQRVYSRSKINLNLANAANHFSLTSLAKCFVGRGPRLRPLAEMKDRLLSLLAPRREQVKGRHFEIPACGGFQMSSAVEGLEACLAEGKEVVSFTDAIDFAQKAAYYLAHEEERRSIARAGMERTLREHTYEQRFKAIFQAALGPGRS